jgi:hypothetical protein
MGFATMSQKDTPKDAFIEAIATAARIWAERWYDGGAPAGPLATLDPPINDVEVLLDRCEAAKLLKVSPTQITRMRAKGQIEPVRRLLPGKVRYLKSDLERFIKKRR